MKQIGSIILFLLVIFSIGCSSKPEQSVEGKIEIGKTVKPFTLNDQFEKPHTLTPDTKMLILVFQKATGHLVKEYFNKKPIDFLEKRDTVFVADVSGMPSIIYSMFAKSDLQKHKYPIWLIFDDNESAKFKNVQNEDKIEIVYLDNLKVTDIKLITTEDELKKIFE